MSQSPTPIRRGADARDTEAFAKQIAANLMTQNDAPQHVSPVCLLYTSQQVETITNTFSGISALFGK